MGACYCTWMGKTHLPIQVNWSELGFGLLPKHYIGIEMNFDEFRRKKLQDPEIAKAYKSLELQTQLARQVRHLRQERGLTQIELADRVNTRQSGISRLENMDALPSLSFLSKIAEALEADIEIRLVPKR